MKYPRLNLLTLIQFRLYSRIKRKVETFCLSPSVYDSKILDSVFKNKLSKIKLIATLLRSANLRTCFKRLPNNMEEKNTITTFLQ